MPDPIVTPQPAADPTPEPQAAAPVAADPTPSPTPDPAVKTWHDSFTDDGLKSSENIKKYKTLDDFGKAFIEKDSLVGRKGVILPKDNDPADLARYYNQLGRPESAGLYKTPEIKVEDNFKQFIAPEKMEQFKVIAHKHGLTQTQYESVVKEYTETQLEDIKSMVLQGQKNVEDANRALMSDWQLDYDANVKQSELAIQSFAEGIPDEKLDSMKSDPDMRRVFLNVAKAISEDRLLTGQSTPRTSVQELQGFIDSQVKIKDSPYWNDSAPDHAAVQAKVAEAYKQLETMRKVAS